MKKFKCTSLFLLAFVLIAIFLFIPLDVMAANENGTINIINQESTTKSPITGSKFQVKNNSTGAVQNVVTGADGKTKVTGLNAGTYSISQVQVATGYNTNSTATTATIASGSKNYSANYTFLNSKIPPVNGVLILTDQDGATKSTISGSSFKVKNNATGETKTFVTGSDGIGTISGLVAGTYTLTQTNVNSVYKLNATPNTITIPSGYSTYTLKYTFYNSKIQSQSTTTNGIVVITNQDSNSKANLSGAKFQIKNNSTGAILTGVAGSNGKATISGLVPGTYTLTQLQAPSGYNVNANPGTITVPTGYNTYTTNFTFMNTSSKNVNGVIVIKNTNSTTKAPIAGATFQVKNNSTGAIKTGVTGSDGKATISGLPVGNYTITQTGAPSTYYINTSPATTSILSGYSTYTVNYTYASRAK